MQIHLLIHWLASPATLLVNVLHGFVFFFFFFSLPTSPFQTEISPTGSAATVREMTAAEKGSQTRSCFWLFLVALEVLHCMHQRPGRAPPSLGPW
ncbi:hypothetical protein K431DRAFT_154180 [Polychaeton citri CBS 116435]|uniref:Uncharacterized protein n=1 Tax=Polychaeton citri CBS 116435 TaxID=1314669 RepID=A0A9P4UL62_9PEZI|nr:hypothetical protein K431DRAFT_154180 [Polychaeton citri CBS 116435]